MVFKYYAGYVKSSSTHCIVEYSILANAAGHLGLLFLQKICTVYALY